MIKKELEALLDTEIGVCSFNAVKNNLIECRNLQRIPKDAKSVILFVFPYKVKQEPPKNICRYAAVPDYHKVCGDILSKYAKTLKETYKNNEFVWFVDNSPIPEVSAAAAAGLGIIGKNGLLITKEYGSYVFIGEIVTDMVIKTNEKSEECINCGRCKEACPVGLNKENCLSAVSQKKGELNDTEKNLLKQSGYLWGCDICALVCPLNKDAKTTYIKKFINGYQNEYTYGQDIKDRAFEWRGDKVIKRNYETTRS